MPGVIGVGSALVDQLGQVPDDFLALVGGRKGGMELIEHHHMQNLLQQLPQAPSQAPGGSAANTVVGLARMGMATAFLCKVGNDDGGHFYRQAAEAAGIAQHGFKIHPEEATGRCLSLITPDSQRTMRTFLGASATLTPEDISASDFTGYSHAHIEGYLLFNEALLRKVLQAAKEAGCTVSLDLAAPEVVEASLNQLPSLLQDYVDMVFANEDEAAAFCGSRDEQAGLDTLAQHCEVAVVKLGSRGALIKRGDETVSVSARLVQAVDTTGAGDLWASGFLFGLLQEADLTKAGTIGAAVAAEVVQQIGAVIPDDSWAKICAEFGIIA